MTGLEKLAASPRALLLTLAGTLLVLTAAVWVVEIAPKQSQSSNLGAQIQAVQTQLASGHHARRGLSIAAANALRTRTAMPGTVAMPQIILELSRIASEEHVSVASVSPSAPTVYAGFDAIPVSLTVTGRFFNVERFLRELRDQVRTTSGRIFASGRLFDVVGVSMTTTTPAPLLTATLSLDAFVYSGLPSPSSTTGTTTTTTTPAAA